MNVLFTILKGFSTGSGLIIAIGAQNAFVLRQGLKGRHLLLTAITCSIIDALLILFGVTGFGYYVSIYPLFVDITKYFASLFLFIYGLQNAGVPSVVFFEQEVVEGSVFVMVVFLDHFLYDILANPHFLCADSADNRV